MRHGFKILYFTLLLACLACGSSGVSDPETIRGTETGNPSEPGPWNIPNNGSEGPPITFVPEAVLLQIKICASTGEAVKMDDIGDCQRAIMNSTDLASLFGVPQGMTAIFGDILTLEEHHELAADPQASAACEADVAANVAGGLGADAVAGNAQQISLQDFMALLPHLIPQNDGSCPSVYHLVD